MAVGGGGGEVPESARPELRAYLGNAMYTKPESQTREEMFGHALATLAEGVQTNNPRKLRMPYVSGKKRIAPHTPGGVLTARWGTSFTTDEYVGSEMGIGQLSFGRIGFGGYLKLNTALKKLNIGEDIGAEKCTILALADGVECASQGQPRRFPDRQRVGVLASGIRMGEILGEEHACGAKTGINMRVAL